MRGSTFGYVLIVVASVMWGTMGIFGKLAFELGILPVPLTALRIMISSLTVLVPMALFRRDLLRIERKDVLRLVVFGVFAVALQRVTYFYAVDLTTATIAAVLFYTYPVFVTIYSVVRLKEKVALSTVLSIVMTFSGVFLVVKAYESTWLGANPLVDFLNQSRHNGLLSLVPDVSVHSIDGIDAKAFLKEKWAQDLALVLHSESKKIWGKHYSTYRTS